MRSHRLSCSAVLAALLRPARSEVLSIRAKHGNPQDLEAALANWNQGLEDAGAGAFAGPLRFDPEDPGGCNPQAEVWDGALALVDSATACEDPAATVDRLAEAGATGVVFLHYEDGLTPLALGDRPAPKLRAVVIERSPGVSLAERLMRAEALEAELLKGKLISEEAYEEQFIFRADEFLATRKENFLWHRHPEMLRSNGAEPLSARLMRSGLEVPRGWFSKPPGFVPLFNPSLLTLDDGAILAVLRMSNGPGCPSVRVSRESSMDTRIFRNGLVLAQLDSNLSVQSHVVVDVPQLTCRFRADMEVGGRLFLDEVHGPMDARIGRATNGEMWIFFYAERNGANNEAQRGMHAAPLRLDWGDCAEQAGSHLPGWSLYGHGVLSADDCGWKGSGNGSSVDDCKASCDAAASCNAVSFKPADPAGSGLPGRCELRSCFEGLTDLSGRTPKVQPMPSWQAWLRMPEVRHWQRSSACVGGWQALGNPTSLSDCKSSCQELPSCNTILFSSALSLCVLQRCPKPGKDAGEGWEAWRWNEAQAGKRRCLKSARLQEDELIIFPAMNGVEKNWNLIYGDSERLLIEYFIEPHIVMEAQLLRNPEGLGGLQLAGLQDRFVSRWPYEVLHGVTNVRGGFCCLQLPASLRDLVASETFWPDLDETLPSLPEGDLLLGAGHLQRIRQPFDQAPGDVSRFRRQAKSRTYHQFFYLLRASEPFDIVAVSPEWCITINGHFSRHWAQVLEPGEEACESIQFVSGLALRGDEVVVAYGINDCESDLLVLPATTVLGMLRPVVSDLNVSLDDMEMI